MIEKTFITKNITNKDIYETLQNIEIQVLKTNGTVKWHGNALWILFLLICALVGVTGAV